VGNNDNKKGLLTGDWLGGATKIHYFIAKRQTLSTKVQHKRNKLNQKELLCLS
jgi:hypothetical protein